MYDISDKVKKELDKLILIAEKYRDNSISTSMFYDVMYGLRESNEHISKYKEYILNNGIRIEDGDDVIEEIDETVDESIDIIPYDPGKIDISLKPMSLSLIVDRLEADEIDLMPDFQRKGGLWNDDQKSQLIESLLLRIPLPAFYFDGSFNDKWIVIDGLQRLTVIKEFFVDKTLSLTGLEFLKDLLGVKFDDLPRVYVRRMLETQIITYIINPGAPVNLKYNIFKRINTGGLRLEPQEIRHALYQGFATKYLKKLAGLEEFKNATGYSIKSDRMLDREFVLRFIAFYELDENNYRGSIEAFLNEAMNYINVHYNEVYANNVEKLFIDVLNTCKDLFGKFAFRKMPDTEKRRPINKALFETWTTILARYRKDQMDYLVRNKKEVINLYIEMCNNDKEFIDSLSSAKIYSVRKRFEKISNLIKGVLVDDTEY